MSTKLIVQLVHIHGPFKGEIQEFSEDIITIGRHPSCLLHFPPDLKIISRKHAEIIREGNRFKLVDHSTNGTLVNGKRVKEIYLRDGDVITFAPGGPKVSFLTQKKEIFEEIKEVKQEKVQEKQSEVIPTQKVSLTIQYGPTLKTFKELPIIIGRGKECHFTIEHPAVKEKHIEISFANGKYWVKDLTFEQIVKVNNQPIIEKTALNPQDIIIFSPEGPRLKFLGEGRLAELEEPAPKEFKEEIQLKELEHPKKQPTKTERIFSVIKKFFKK